MHDEAVVLGGGWSVSQLPDYKLVVAQLVERYDVITANDSALFCAPHTIVSMDRLWAEHRIPQILERYATLRQCPPEIWLRKDTYPADPAVNFYTCDIADGVPMSETPGVLNGNNSGAVALNVAFQRSYKRVFMLGFDMQQGPQKQQHWYDDWTDHRASTGHMRNHWLPRFESIYKQFAGKGVELINVSCRTAIPREVIPLWNFQKFLSAR